MEISCTNSTACEDMRGFCNFDYGTSGFCQACSSIGSGECENSGFNYDKGKTECQRLCVEEESK